MNAYKSAVTALAAFIVGGGVGYHSGMSAGQAALDRAEVRLGVYRERIDKACRILADVTPDDDGVQLAGKAALLIAVSPDVDFP